MWVGQAITLLLDRQPPTGAADGRLELPLQQMHEQDRETVGQLALLGLAHAFDLFGDMRDVRLGQPPGPQQRGLFVRPGIEILVVETGGGHHTYS